MRAISSLMNFTEWKQFEEKRGAPEEVSRLKNHLREVNMYLQEEIKFAHNVNEIIGRSNAIKYVLFKIEQVSQTDSTVMILGETTLRSRLLKLGIQKSIGIF